jgi:TatD DNase family protein
MNLVDVHCHINHELFKDKLDEVLKRAKDAGVKAILLSGVNPENNREVMELSKKYPIIKASLGIYPTDAIGMGSDETGLLKHVGKIDVDAELKYITDNLDSVAAIGEIGMDFYWATKEETYSEQSEIFRKIIKFAIKVKKPIVIHSRKAEEECLNILEEEIKNKEIPIVQHCFSGRKSLMSRAIELGHYFSIPPNILVASNFQTLVKKAPLSQLLTETDAPWLSPIKGQPNEPAFVVKTIEKIAEVKNLSKKEVAEAVWNNYQKVFNVQ